jgi:hypothetical protein
VLSNIRRDAYGGRINAKAELADWVRPAHAVLDDRVVVDHDGRTHAHWSAARLDYVCRTISFQVVTLTEGEVVKPKHAIAVRQRRRIVRRYESK